jgi:serine/threonine protein kinase/WD40 repeat protein
MTDHANDAESIFLGALEQATPQLRAEHVKRACADDLELLQRVRELLDCHERPHGPLDAPPSGLGSAVDLARPRERPGNVIGAYKLLQQIGEGGMGAVFMAEQIHPVQRKVALKVIKAGMDSTQVIARFEAERQALAVMDHVNIARVLDAGTTEVGRPYFVMELVHGVPITQYCDDNQLTPRERLELFVPVCQAIQHAHQKGIIHRDIKPSNVMVTLYDGKPVPKVIDFGVAKATEQKLTERTNFTQYGTMVGTPEYTSPEQAEMSGLGVDTRTDIYSLGVLLYELLTGSTPLTHQRLKQAAYAEILRMVKEEEPPKPSTRLSDSKALPSISAQRKTEPAKLTKLIRGELDWIVMKCLEKDRNRRYESASAFAADVQRYLADEPVHACPPSAGYRLRKFVRRNKGPVLAASLLLVALLSGIVGTTWGMIRATDAETEARNEAEQKATALTDKEAALSTSRQSERDAKDRLFLALLNQARSGRFSRQMGQRLDSLAALEKAARIRPDERLRDEAIAAMALPDIRRGPSLHALPAGTKGCAFDAQYQTYARIDAQGAISIRSVQHDEEIRCIKTQVKGPPSGLWLSPDGQFTAVRDEHGGVRLWRVTDDMPLSGEVTLPCSTLAFSPDSRQLAIAQDDWVVYINLGNGQEVSRWRLPAKAHALAYSPDNGRLAVGYASNNVVSIFDCAQGSHIADLPVGSMNLQYIAWHPDGMRLAVAGSDPRIQIWDVIKHRKLATLEGHVEQVTGLTFHPGGGLLASASWEGVVRLWDPGTGRQLLPLPLDGDLRFSSTGDYLGYLWSGDGHVQLLEVAQSREYRTIVSSGGGDNFGAYQEGDISPDGRLLALGMGGAGDRLWELSSGRELATLPTGSICALFQPDGRELLTCGADGLYRWPIRERKETANDLRLGPPRMIALPVAPVRAARSPDGRTLAMVSERSGAGLRMDLKAESVPGQLYTHPNASEVALSRDGRWIASSGWHSDRVRLWNAQTGAMVYEWVLGTQTLVFFTPDSRALIICRGDAFTFWDVDTLHMTRRLGRDVPHMVGRVAFSADGKLMALEMAPAVIHLMEVATGRTVAKLEDPNGDRATWMGFTPDGTQLVVAARYARAIHVWDLRAIRERLKIMGLDWDWPEFLPADHTAKTAEPAKIEVLMGDLATPPLEWEQKARQKIERLRLAHETNPDDAEACNNLAWQYATAPEALRDVKAALPLAEKAVRLEPGKTLYRNTLGVVYYRAERYREAVEALRSNLDKQEDSGLAFDLYFLAMSHHRLGETALARDFYHWAVRWSQAQRGLSKGHLEELALFRAEAENLLRIETKKD